MIVDMHCHLDLYPKPFDIAEQCTKKDVYALSVTTTPKAWSGTKKLEVGNSRVRTALGLHPQLAHDRFRELELFDQLLPEARYVGEIGLDGGKEFKKHWEVQLKVFRRILESVDKAGGRIMSIHSILSASAVLDELRRISGVPILHWFSGSKPDLCKAIDQGCWFSVGPAMLSSKKGMEIASLIPKNKILTESDGPFAQIRGRSLMPWDSYLAVKKLAEIWEVSELETEQTIKCNLKDLSKVSL